MTAKVEVIYFPKPCPHCKEMLFRVTKMHAAWSECRNEKCPFVVPPDLDPLLAHIRQYGGTGLTKSILEPLILELKDRRRAEPTPYTECHNRR